MYYKLNSFFTPNILAIVIEIYDFISIIANKCFTSFFFFLIPRIVCVCLCV